MATNLNAIIRAITPINNRYRDPSSPVRVKLETLWEMGDELVRLGVNKPHSLGWAIQRQTKGLIKRPTVFRSHKIRSIWSSRDEFIRDVGRIPHLSRLTEILPLIDPAQYVRGQLTKEQLADIYKHAREDSTRKFKDYVLKLKKAFSSGKLGKPLDRNKHLSELHEIVAAFEELRRLLLRLLAENCPDEREAFRNRISEEELRSFSNMCISLTTKDNRRLYKRIGPTDSASEDEKFKMLYDYSRRLLGKESDVERARLRRLISADAFAQMSDAISSIRNEEGVEDYRERQKISIGL